MERQQGDLSGSTALVQARATTAWTRAGVAEVVRMTSFCMEPEGSVNRSAICWWVGCGREGSQEPLGRRASNNQRGLACSSRPVVFKCFTYKITWGSCQKYSFRVPSPGEAVCGP